jgi:organic hydroperoxide reductase OsmC/OhrA
MNAPVSTAHAVQLTHINGFRFRVRFQAPAARDLITDEPLPLGTGTGPNPTELLAAAVGNCLASSLLFCTDKAHLEVVALETEVDVEMRRNEQGRLRIGTIHVRLEPEADLEAHRRMARCIGLYESFCTVTDSIRHGIDVQVEIAPKLAGDSSVLPRPQVPSGACGVHAIDD